MVRNAIVFYSVSHRMCQSENVHSQSGLYVGSIVSFPLLNGLWLSPAKFSTICSAVPTTTAIITKAYAKVKIFAV